MSLLQSMLNRLTDVYKKDSESNVAKLLALFSEEIEELNGTFNKVQEFQDIDQAEGSGLDRHGRNVLESRGQKDDEEYRQFIKTKIQANLSKGDIETINEIIDVFLGQDFKGLEELWGNELFEHEPAALKSTIKSNNQIPFEAIGRVIAGGVRLQWELITESEINMQSTYTRRTSPLLLCGTFLCGTHPPAEELEVAE